MQLIGVLSVLQVITITTRGRFLNDKLVVVKLVKKFSHIYGTRN